MAQASTSQRTANPTTNPNDTGDGVVRGKVTDARTGANVKGALVTITETGQSTRTDDLGGFRFVKVPLGKQTLTFSYLGAAPSVATIEVISGGTNAMSIALSNSIEEIVVVGQRSARASSLNLQRTAPNNSDVVSSDMLGNFTGTTISEALRHVSGITFQQSSLTGEGTNIIVRGLEPDMNTVTLNGVRLPDNSGTGRSGDLNNVLADSISKVTVNKSLLPSHDSSGTGGLIEIETKSPLDRPKRYFNASIEGGQTGKNFNDDLLASGTASLSFGAEDQFGFSTSVQYRERSFDSVSQEQQFQFGQYLPLEADGITPIMDPFHVDPRRLFPFEEGADNIYPMSQSAGSKRTDTTNLTIGLAAEWQVSTDTNLRLDVSKVDADQDVFRRQGGEFYFSLYQPSNVIALGGEPRQALTYFNALNTSRNLGASQSNNKTDLVSLRGVSEVGNWTFEYGGGYTKGSRDSADSSIVAGAFMFHDSAFVLPAATDPVEGGVPSIFAPVAGGIQQPLLTQAGFDFLNDPSLYALRAGNLVRLVTSNERKTAEFSGRYAFGGDTLNYVEAGVFYESAGFDFERWPGQDSFDQFRGSGATAADIGLTIGTDIWSRIEAPSGVGTLGEANLNELIARMRSLDGNGVTILTHPLDSRLAPEFTREEEFSGYFESSLNFGKLEIIGGARVAQVKTTATKLSRPALRLVDGSFDAAFAETHAEIVNFDDTVTDVLPRVLANYRQSENLIFRGGYYFTVSRPTIDSLSRFPEIVLSLFPFGGPGNDRPTLSVSMGNPGLKPAFTHNFDLGVELYDDNIGVIKLGLFYKRIDNFIDSNVSSTSAALDGIPLPDDPRFENLPSDILITVSRPSNAADTAEIWGAEAGVEHRFSGLTGLLDGLGVYANYTFSDSSREATRVWRSSPIVDINGTITGREQIVYVREAPFAQQSRHSGTAALTYEHDNLDASLSYSVQARSLRNLGDHGFDVFEDLADSLDLRAEYRLFPDRGGRYRLWLEAQNLLDGTSDPTVSQSLGGEHGIPELTTFRSYVGGRSIKLGVSATF